MLWNSIDPPSVGSSTGKGENFSPNSLETLQVKWATFRDMVWFFTSEPFVICSFCKFCVTWVSDIAELDSWVRDGISLLFLFDPLHSPELSIDMIWPTVILLFVLVCIIDNTSAYVCDKESLCYNKDHDFLILLFSINEVERYFEEHHVRFKVWAWPFEIISNISLLMKNLLFVGITVVARHQEHFPHRKVPFLPRNARSDKLVFHKVFCCPPKRKGGIQP